MTSEQKLQLRAFARWDGARLGMMWVASFALFVASFSYPFCGILWMATMVATPFLVASLTRAYSEQTPEKHVSYSMAFSHSSRTVFYASLILAIAQWVYFQFMDNGFLINTYAAILTDKENAQRLATMGYTKEMIGQMLDAFRALRPIDIVLQMMFLNMVAGLIISITTALYVSFRHTKQR
ncbi:MAG: DUF4199 domain-containing protein [Prevotella sp.]|nr:DUF4199 domain-containing protein [Prevotella sp.]